ncbi:MAG: formylglycine-generating enzyme family protein [Blastocatellia bacterium]|nr:formylglycine-generating enzyme family protein [Blastocatellia bacterium]
MLTTFSFETSTLNEEGQEVERASGTVSGWSQTLPDGIMLELVEIPSGTFLMGSPASEGEPDERPPHWVTIPSFFMGRFQITQAEWRAIASLPQVKTELAAQPSHFEGDRLPVEKVTWFDALEGCARLSHLTGRIWRLPSEAEWEYACRAGTTTPFAFGETLTGAIANFDAHLPYKSEPEGEYRFRTVEVGSLGVANEFGLFDLHGNVWEWCLDVWHDSYVGAPTDGSSWTTGGNQALRVLRGGSWDYVAHGCRSAFRDRGNPRVASPFNGLRVVMEQIP